MTAGAIVILIVFALLAVTPVIAAEDPAPEGAAPSVLVATQAPVQASLDQTVTAYGIVQAAPGGSIGVASLHAAQVLKLRVVQGQVVRQGEALLDLGADPAASLAYVQAASDLDLAKSELGRTKQLLAERLATGSQLDQAAKAVRDAEATLAARQREGGAKPVETLAAPIAGVVTNIAIANGDHVQPGVTLLTLAGAGGLVAIVGVAPDERAQVKPSQSARLVDLDAPAAAIAGAVSSIGGMADPKTGQFTAVVAPADAAAQLVPGSHVRATIETDKVSGWIVPRSAVLVDNDGPYLFQVAGGKAARVAVSIEGAAGDRLAVSGPVDAGKKLVVSGNYQLSDGMAVREQEQAR